MIRYDLTLVDLTSFLFYVQTWKFIYIISHSGWSLAWIFMKERVKGTVIWTDVAIEILTAISFVCLSMSFWTLTCCEESSAWVFTCSWAWVTMSALSSVRALLRACNSKISYFIHEVLNIDLLRGIFSMSLHLFLGLSYHVSPQFCQSLAQSL